MMCQDGVRNRSVTCRNSRDNLLVANFMCQSDIRPTSSEQCSDLFPLPCFLDPVWIPYPWSRVSANDYYKEMCTLLVCIGGYYKFETNSSRLTHTRTHAHAHTHTVVTGHQLLGGGVHEML